MLDFKGLETFLWVVSLGSFRGAAQKLNTTQPAISQRIAQLEDELGVKLLSREIRAVTPTPAGRQLLAYAEKLIAMRSELLATVRDQSAVRGVLRLGVAETIVHTWLPRFITAVGGTYPNLSLEIDVDITRTLQAKLLSQEIDLAFLVGPVSAPGIRNRLLNKYPLAFVASPKLNIPSDASIQQLAGFPVFTFPRRTQPYVLVRSIFNRPDMPPVNLNASSSLATIVRLAVGGFGVAVIPHEIVKTELESGALDLIGIGIDIPELVFTAAWLSSPDTLSAELVADIAVQIAGS
jgi:DNA-binding transcriptional LysR family regulator